MLLVTLLMAGCAASAAQMDQPTPDTSVTQPSFEALADEAMDQLLVEKGTSFTIHPFRFPVGTVYVATTGDDANSGTQSAPVRTLTRAVERSSDSSALIVYVKILGDSYALNAHDMAGYGIELGVDKIILISPAGSTRVRCYPETQPTGPSDGGLFVRVMRGFLAFSRVQISGFNLGLMTDGPDRKGWLALVDSVVGDPDRQWAGQDYFINGSLGVNSFDAGHQVTLANNVIHVEALAGHGIITPVRLFGYNGGRVEMRGNTLQYPDSREAIAENPNHDWNCPLLVGVIAQGAGICVSQNRFQSENHPAGGSFLVVGVEAEPSGYPGGDNIVLSANDCSSFQGSPMVLRAMGSNAVGTFSN